MWFNSMQREEPYQSLKSKLKLRKLDFVASTGGAWLSSARVVRCCLKWRNERNPHCLFLTRLTKLPSIRGRKERTTSSHHAPYVLGHTRVTMVVTKSCNPVTASESQKRDPSSDWGLKFAPMKSESVVIPGQPYGGEYDPGPCTHRPSHHESWPNLKSSLEPIWTRIPKVGLAIGVKS